MEKTNKYESMLCENYITRMADFLPESLNEEKRTVDVIFTTNHPVYRYSYSLAGGGYYEILSLREEHVDLSRLNNGAPLLSNHDTELDKVIGVVVHNSATVDGEKGYAKVRFAEDEYADKIYQKVKAGILTNVSIGYIVTTMEEKEEKKGEVPVFTAVEWEPYEISIVSIPADNNAKVRDHKKQTSNVYVKRSHKKMDEKKQEKVVKEDVVKEDVVKEERSIDVDSIVENSIKEERTRVESIMKIVSKAGLESSFSEKMISSGNSLDKVREIVLDKLSSIDASERITSNVKVDGKDEGETLRRGLQDYLLFKGNSAKYKLTEEAKQFKGMNLVSMGRRFLEKIGESVYGKGSREIANRALGSSDFPFLLANVMGKTLRDGYESAPQTFEPIIRRATAPDFKQITRVQMGEAPRLEKVIEDGKFQYGKFSESKEVYKISTYGKILPFTRQMMINDDLDALSRIPAMFGRAVADLESDLVWSVVTDNAQMGDGVTLFHASHNNLGSPASAISIASLGEARKSMRLHKGLDGLQILNLMPMVLVVPASLEGVAEQFLSPNTFPAQASQVNPYSGKLQLIVEPRLDANSPLDWYVFADPGQIDMIELASLEGEAGPSYETQVGFDVDGMAIKVRSDLGVKAIDHRGMYKYLGA